MIAQEMIGISIGRNSMVLIPDEPLELVPKDALLGIGHGQPPRICFVRVSPLLAEFLLEYNRGNRRISQPFTNAFRDDMRTREWRVNGSSIIVGFDEGGVMRLLDGQKRLTACVAEGVSFDTLYIVGLHHDALPTIDSGQSRLVNQQLKFSGEDWADKQMVGILRTLALFSIDGVSKKSRVSAQFTKRIFGVYKASALFSMELFKNKGRSVGVNAVLAAAITRTHQWLLKMDPDSIPRLGLFVELFPGGVVPSQADTAISTLKRIAGVGGQTVQCRERYFVASLLCLDRFIREKPYHDVHLRGWEAKSGRFTSEAGKVARTRAQRLFPLLGPPENLGETALDAGE